MRCALVSRSLDLRGLLGAEFARIADRVEIVDHRRRRAGRGYPLAIAWHPPDDAFEHYPNLQVVCSIGAGVDNIIACPSRGPVSRSFESSIPRRRRSCRASWPGM